MFKIGDTVIVKDGGGNQGRVATIRAPHPRQLKRWIVEFHDPNRGHDCGERMPSGNGWFVDSLHLTLTEITPFDKLVLAYIRSELST